MRRFYAPQIASDQNECALDASETRHLRDVLRLRVGAAVNVFDGLGREFTATVAKIERRETILREIREIAPVSSESNLQLTLAPALLKGEKFDLVVQKCVELGVNSLSPLLTIRSEPRLRDTDGRLERWRRIALEATKQCGRARLMEISAPVGFSEFAAENRDAVLFSERGGERMGLGNPEMLTVVVGPEGGWDDTELALAREMNMRLITLGGRIMRAETAAIAIAAIVQHDCGDLN